MYEEHPVLKLHNYHHTRFSLFSSALLVSLINSLAYLHMGNYVDNVFHFLKIINVDNWNLR